MKVQASVARCLRTPPYLARGKGFKVSVLLPLRRQLRPEHDCRWQLCFCEPITVVSHRDKATPLHVRRSCFGPVSRQRRVLGGAAGYRPRVRSAYSERVYAHSPRCREQSEYRGFARLCKGGSRTRPAIGARAGAATAATARAPAPAQTRSTE